LPQLLSTYSKFSSNNSPKSNWFLFAF
jgi:hypothetical protein